LRFNTRSSNRLPQPRPVWSPIQELLQAGSGTLSAPMVQKILQAAGTAHRADVLVAMVQDQLADFGADELGSVASLVEDAAPHSAASLRRLASQPSVHSGHAQRWAQVFATAWQAAALAPENFAHLTSGLPDFPDSEHLYPPPSGRTARLTHHVALALAPRRHLGTSLCKHVFVGCRLPEMDLPARQALQLALAYQGTAAQLYQRLLRHAPVMASLRFSAALTLLGSVSAALVTAWLQAPEAAQSLRSELVPWLAANGLQDAAVVDALLQQPQLLEPVCANSVCAQQLPWAVWICNFAEIWQQVAQSRQLLAYLLNQQEAPCVALALTVLHGVFELPHYLWPCLVKLDRLPKAQQHACFTYLLEQPLLRRLLPFQKALAPQAAVGLCKQLRLSTVLEQACAIELDILPAFLRRDENAIAANSHRADARLLLACLETLAVSPTGNSEVRRTLLALLAVCDLEDLEALQTANPDCALLLRGHLLQAPGAAAPSAARPDSGLASTAPHLTAGPASARAPTAPYSPTQPAQALDPSTPHLATQPGQGLAFAAPPHLPPWVRAFLQSPAVDNSQALTRRLDRGAPHGLLQGCANHLADICRGQEPVKGKLLQVQQVFFGMSRGARTVLHGLICAQPDLLLWPLYRLNRRVIGQQVVTGLPLLDACNLPASVAKTLFSSLLNVNLPALQAAYATYLHSVVSSREALRHPACWTAALDAMGQSSAWLVLGALAQQPGLRQTLDSFVTSPGLPWNPRADADAKAELQAAAWLYEVAMADPAAAAHWYATETQSDRCRAVEVLFQSPQLLQRLLASRGSDISERADIEPAGAHFEPTVADFLHDSKGCCPWLAKAATQICDAIEAQPCRMLERDEAVWAQATPQVGQPSESDASSSAVSTAVVVYRNENGAQLQDLRWEAQIALYLQQQKRAWGLRGCLPVPVGLRRGSRRQGHVGVCDGIAWRAPPKFGIPLQQAADVRVLHTLSQILCHDMGRLHAHGVMVEPPHQGGGEVFGLSGLCGLTHYQTLNLFMEDEGEASAAHLENNALKVWAVLSRSFLKSWATAAAAWFADRPQQATPAAALANLWVKGFATYLSAVTGRDLGASEDLIVALQGWSNAAEQCLDKCAAEPTQPLESKLRCIADFAAVLMPVTN
jgi:hypothetical protein